LIARVSDPSLQEALRRETARLKGRLNFGLVFERHLPERVVLAPAHLKPGDQVVLRADEDPTEYTVTGVRGGSVRLRREGDTGEITARVEDLRILQPLGRPSYPALAPLGGVEKAPGAPKHAVIEGENYFALQLLSFILAGSVDCIYIDPPYNTGARDWKYNNRFVDNKDQWRHSKWLSFMERRLRLAKRLLKPDGVLIVTIDEHEVMHLGCVLEDVFKAPAYAHTVITDVINPKGTGATNFSRVAEYVIFVCPEGKEVISAVPFGFGMSGDVPVRDHRVVEAQGGGLVRKLALRRDGAESSNRKDRPRQFYALLVDPNTNIVEGIGPGLSLSDTYPTDPIDGRIPVYPVDAKGRERVWRYGRDTMSQRISAGEIVVTRVRDGRYSLYHLKPVDAQSAERRRPRTVWWTSTHDAGSHGSSLLNEMLGERSAFTFPKSLYSVADALRLVVGDRPEATILDFFAGSGTTLHATCLLNSEDGGKRRAILVTNNEVDAATSARLTALGTYPGDAEYEAAGIFQSVTRPRVEALITGHRTDGRCPAAMSAAGRWLTDLPRMRSSFVSSFLITTVSSSEKSLPLSLRPYGCDPALMGGGMPLRPNQLRGRYRAAVPMQSSFARAGSPRSDWSSSGIQT